MKTTIFIFIGLSLATVSCRKERTCECNTTATEVRSGFGAQTTVGHTSEKVTKEKQRKKFFDADQNCYSYMYSYNDDGGAGSTAWSSVTTVDVACEIK